MSDHVDEIFSLLEKAEVAAPKGVIPKRRIPGTLALASTNLTAAFLLVNPEGFADVPVHRYAVNLIPSVAWGLLFAGAAVMLLVAVVVRRWKVFNVGAALSMFAWTSLCLLALASSLRGGSYLSPVAIALFVWMLTGQAAMLFAPLTVERLEGDG